MNKKILLFSDGKIALFEGNLKDIALIFKVDDDIIILEPYDLQETAEYKLAFYK